MEMFGNAAAAASLVHAGLSAGGLSDHLAGLEACASLSNTGFGISTSSSTLTETTSPLVGLATSSVLASGRIGNHTSGSISNHSTPSNHSHYPNSSPYSAHQNPALNSCHPYQQASPLYHNNYTSSGASSLGYQDSISNSFPGLTYPGTSPNNTTAQQRLFHTPSLTAPSTPANITTDSLLSEGNGINSSLLSSSSSNADKDSNFNRKIRKDSNYSPPNISSSFLPSSTVKIKTGTYVNRLFFGNLGSICSITFYSLSLKLQCTFNYRRDTK